MRTAEMSDIIKAGHGPGPSSAAGFRRGEINCRSSTPTYGSNTKLPHIPSRADLFGNSKRRLLGVFGVRKYCHRAQMPACDQRPHICGVLAAGEAATERLFRGSDEGLYNLQFGKMRLPDHEPAVVIYIEPVRPTNDR